MREYQFDGLVGRISNPSKAYFLSTKDSLLHHEQQEISHTSPEFSSHQNQREWPDFAALQQGGGFKQFVKSAKPTGQNYVGARLLHQHHLAGKEVVEVDHFVHIGIGLLLVRKDDVAADANSSAFILFPPFLRAFDDSSKDQS